MARGVLFTPSTGEVLRSPYEVSKDQVLFNPEDAAEIVDIYYGASSATTTTTPQLTSSEVKTWSKLSGYIGGLHPNFGGTPRNYTLTATINQYQYWAIPDSTGDGLKVVNLLTRTGGGLIVPLWSTMSSGIKIAQSNPLNTPVPGYTKQTIYYYLMDIDGVNYRIYRQSGKNTLGNVVVDMFSIEI